MAVDYRGITIEIDGETSGLSAKLKEIRDDAKYVYSGLKDIDKALKFDPENVTLLAQKQENLAKAIENTKARQDTYRAGLEALSKVAEENGSLTDKQQAQYDQLQRGIITCQQQIETYQTQLESLTSTERANVEQTEALAEEHEKLADRLKNAGANLQEIGDAATVGITAPLVAGAKSAVDAAVDIDTALTDVRKTVDGTEEDYQRLKDAAIAASEVQPVSADEILSIEALGAQLGYSIDELEDFGRVVSGLDIATNMDAETAATELAQFANITNMAHEDTERYASTIVGLGNNLATTESDISNMAQRVAAAGTQIGMSQADVLGLSAAMASLGINAEAGGTNISKIMSQIDKDVAASSDGVQAWADAAGMSAEAFAQAWETDPVNALQAVFAGMQTATTEGSNLSVMLQDLGIKSNQAVDVAKRMTNGAELVAEAIDIANESWRENTALTKEVENRNDSLAAKFEVLKNRVQNMLAEVGEPIANALIEMVDAAQPVIDGIAGLAQAFADLPEPIQQAMVTAGTLVAAFGPVESIFGRILTASGGVVGGMGELKAAFSLAMEEIAAGTGVIESVTEATGALSAGLQAGLVGVGIAAAVAGISALVGTLEDYRQHQEDVLLATTGLADAMSAMDEAAAKYNDAIDSAAEHTQNFKDRINEVINNGAELAREMKEDWSELGEKNAGLDRYVEQIAELSKQGKLTSEDMAVLNNAIEQVNDITGSTIPTMENANDTLALNADQVREIAEAWEQQEQVAQHQEDYNKLLEQQALAHDALADATNNAISAQKDYGSEFNQYLKTLSTAPSNTGAYTSAMFDLKAAVAEADEAVERARQGMAESEYTFSSVETALVSTGVTMEELASLTDAQMAAIRKAFDGTASSAVKALDKIKSAAREAQNTPLDLPDAPSTSTSKSSYSVTDDPRYTNQKKLNDQLYKEQQRAYEAEIRALQDQQSKVYSAKQKELDNQLKLAQDAYRKEEDALRKSLDQQYDLRKSELDKTYSATSATLSKEYDELKTSLDKQTSAAKEAYSKQLSDLKSSLSKQVEAQKAAYSKQIEELRSSLDAQVEAQRKANESEMRAIREMHSAEETALKKSLDAQYKQRSKEVTKAYKEFSKSQQKQLKEAKAAYSAETKAFKAESKDRIAQIKAEYDAKKRAIAENDGTTGIDAQIKQIEDEQAAEDAARKQRERDEKLSELRMAVEQAKTRRTRQDAEQALSEYLNQLAEEDADAARERQIKSLEEKKAAIAEETKARQSQLDEERDLVISEYESRRELELEQLQASQDAKYELLSAELERQAELRKESDDAYLESYRESLDAQHQALVDQHARDEESRQEAFAAQIEQMQANNAAQIEQQQAFYDAEIEQMVAANDAQLEQMRVDNEAQLEQMRENATQQLEEKKAQNSQILEEQKARDAQELESLKETNTGKIEELKSAHTTALETIRSNNSEVLNQIKSDQAEQLRVTREHNADTLADYREKLNEGLSELKTKLKEGADATATETERAKTSVTTATDSIKGTVTTATGEVKRNIDTTSADVGKKFTETSTTIDKTVGDTTSKVETKISGLSVKIGKSVDDAATKAKGTVTKATGDIDKDVGNVSSKTKTTVDTTTKAVGKSVSDTSKSTQKDVETAGKAIEKTTKDTSTNAKNEAEKGAQGVSKAVKDEIGKLPQWAETEGKEIVSKLASGLQDTGQVSSAAQNISSSISQALDNYDYTNTGRNIIIGMINGMNAEAPNLYNTAQEIANNVSTTINNSLQVNSPSRVTTKTGEYVGEGLIVGMENRRRALLKVASDIASAVGDALTPTVDLTETKRQFDAELDDLYREKQSKVDALRDEGELKVANARRNGASDAEIRAITEKYGELIARANVDQSRSIDELMSAQSRQLALLEEQQRRLDNKGQTVDGIQRGVGTITSSIVASVERQVVEQTVNVNVTLNNPVVRDDFNVRTLVRQVKNEIRREAAYRL